MADSAEIDKYGSPFLVLITKTNYVFKILKKKTQTKQRFSVLQHGLYSYIFTACGEEHNKLLVHSIMRVRLRITLVNEFAN